MEPNVSEFHDGFDTYNAPPFPANGWDHTNGVIPQDPSINMAFGRCGMITSGPITCQMHRNSIQKSNLPSFKELSLIITKDTLIPVMSVRDGSVTPRYNELWKMNLIGWQFGTFNGKSFKICAGVSYFQASLKVELHIVLSYFDGSQWQLVDVVGVPMTTSTAGQTFSFEDFQIRLWKQYNSITKKFELHAQSSIYWTFNTTTYDTGDVIITLPSGRSCEQLQNPTTTCCGIGTPGFPSSMLNGASYDSPNFFMDWVQYNIDGNPLPWTGSQTSITFYDLTEVTSQYDYKEKIIVDEKADMKGMVI